MQAQLIYKQSENFATSWVSFVSQSYYQYQSLVHNQAYTQKCSLNSTLIVQLYSSKHHVWMKPLSIHYFDPEARTPHYLQAEKVCCNCQDNRHSPGTESSRYQMTLFFNIKHQILRRSESDLLLKELTCKDIVGKKASLANLANSLRDSYHHRGWWCRNCS